LSNRGANKVGQFLDKLWQKKGKESKKKCATKRRPEADPEIMFLKRSKMDEQSILKMQRPKFQLDGNDVDIGNSAMLTSKHTQMAQELLHQQFPHIEGLLSPTIGTAQQFPVTHWWVCVSNIGCRQKNEVRLYDSLYRGILQFTKEQIAALLFIQDSDQIEISITPVDQQTNGKDCGVFAVAFATALCYKLDLASQVRITKNNHLYINKLTIFPQNSVQMTSCFSNIPALCCLTLWAL